MSPETLTQVMLNAIEEELIHAVTQGHRQELNNLYAMMAYHMGWEGEGAGVEAVWKTDPASIGMLNMRCSRWRMGKKSTCSGSRGAGAQFFLASR